MNIVQTEAVTANATKTKGKKGKGYWSKGKQKLFASLLQGANAGNPAVGLGKLGSAKSAGKTASIAHVSMVGATNKPQTLSEASKKVTLGDIPKLKELLKEAGSLKEGISKLESMPPEKLAKLEELLEGKVGGDKYFTYSDVLGEMFPGVGSPEELGAFTDIYNFVQKSKGKGKGKKGAKEAFALDLKSMSKAELTEVLKKGEKNIWQALGIETKGKGDLGPQELLSQKLSTKKAGKGKKAVVGTQMTVPEAALAKNVMKKATGKKALTGMESLEVVSKTHHWVPVSKSNKASKTADGKISLESGKAVKGEAVDLKVMAGKAIPLADKPKAQAPENQTFGKTKAETFAELETTKKSGVPRGKGKMPLKATEKLQTEQGISRMMPEQGMKEQDLIAELLGPEFRPEKVALPDDIAKVRKMVKPEGEAKVASATATRETVATTEVKQTAETPMQQSVFKQTEEGMRTAYILKPKSVTVKLNPEDLGEMKIRVSIENDQLQAKIQTESHKVASILRENQSDLEHRLREQGMDFEKIDVRDDLNQEKEQSKQKQQAQDHLRDQQQEGGQTDANGQPIAAKQVDQKPEMVTAAASHQAAETDDLNLVV